MKIYEIYEHQAIKAHSINFGHKTYHWKELNIKTLHASGWAILYKDIKKWLKGKIGREYGLDGISVDEESTYHGIQVKYRKKDSSISAHDIPTFFDVVTNRLRTHNPQSTGFLYISTEKISPSLLSSCNHGGFLHIIHLEFNPDFNLDFNENIPREITTFSRENYQLRYYQEECLKALKRHWTGTRVIAMICGTGKTLVFCTYATLPDYFNRVIVLSPTRLLADQNRNRFQEFIDQTKWLSLLVDSDGKDSTRDKEEVRELWNQDLDDTNVFISSTFYSAKDVLNEVIFKPKSHTNSKKTLVIVDEAHNLTPEVIKMLSVCKKCLFVTGTPPTKLQDEFESDKIQNPWDPKNIIYSYPLRQAINDGYITDYEIYIPLIETVYDKKNENYMKAQFLVEGMIQQQCKRTIVYCSSIKECDIVKKHFKKASDEFFEEDEFEIFIITSQISSSKRNKILKEFQSNQGGKYKIILSVRILDEGIDLIKTDSIYITNPNPSNDPSDWKRMIQRMCRANRLDPNNPDKIACVFIWSPDTEKVHKCFELMKEADIEFISRLRLLKMGIFNDEIDTPEKSSEFIETVQNATKDLQIKWKIKCMTVKEKYDYYLEKTEEYFRQHGRMPSFRYIIPESGSRLGIFLNSVKFNSTRLSEAQKQRLLNLNPNFFVSRKKSTKLSTPRIVEELLKFEKQNKRLPYRNETIILEEDGSKYLLGVHWDMIKQKKKPGMTDKLRQDILNVFPKAFDIIQNEIEQIVDKFLEFEKKNKRWPLRQDDKMEINGELYVIGIKFRALQLNPRKYLSEELIRKLEERDSLWILTLTERTTLKKIEKCIEFFKNNERWPKQQENKNYPLENGEKFNIGTFWNSVKQGVTSISEDSHKEIIKLDSTVVIKIKENKKRKRE